MSKFENKHEFKMNKWRMLGSISYRTLAEYLRRLEKYRKIPKISPEAYIFQRPLLRRLFLEGLIFGGAYLRRQICVSKSLGLAL